MHLVYFSVLISVLFLAPEHFQLPCFSARRLKCQGHRQALADFLSKALPAGVGSLEWKERLGPKLRVWFRARGFRVDDHDGVNVGDEIFMMIKLDQTIQASMVPVQP